MLFSAKTKTKKVNLPFQPAKLNMNLNLGNELISAKLSQGSAPPSQLKLHLKSQKQLKMLRLSSKCFKCQKLFIDVRYVHLAQLDGRKTKVLAIARVQPAQVADEAPAKSVEGRLGPSLGRDSNRVY